MVRSETRVSAGRRLPKSVVLTADGDKGGAGKSVVARAVVHVLTRNGFEVQGFDADARNAHLHRFCSPSIEVQRVYLRTTTGWDELYNAMQQVERENPIVIDLPANIGETIEAEMPRLRRVFELRGRELFRIWVIDEEDDGIQLLRSSRHVTPYSRTFVVKNGRFGPEEVFELWHESDTRKQLLTEGGLDAYVPALPIRVRTKIRNARCSFADAFALDLTDHERIDLEIWLDQIEIAFQPLLEWIQR